MITMVEIKKELLSPCGLYCGVCGVYLAYKENDSKLKQDLFPRFKIWGAKTADDIVCEGCLSDGIVFPFCQSCTIKDCINNKGIEGCHQCDDFPCEIIMNWPSPIGKKVMLDAIPKWRELGTEKWIEEVEKKYMCPECEKQLYRGATKCNKCNSKVNLL